MFSLALALPKKRTVAGANARCAMIWTDVLRAHAFFTRLEQTPANEAVAA